MFKDYYELLEVSESASQDEIKRAFRKQVIKWHPDQNQGVDTTFQMQEINEAYLILKDPDARSRYNKEYQRFKAYTKQKNEGGKASFDKGKYQKHEKEAPNNTDFVVEDDVLDKWMNNAKRQAVDLAQQTIRDFKDITKAAAGGCVTGVMQLMVWIIAINLIFLLLRMCD